MLAAFFIKFEIKPMLYFHHTLTMSCTAFWNLKLKIQPFSVTAIQSGTRDICAHFTKICGEMQQWLIQTTFVTSTKRSSACWSMSGIVSNKAISMTHSWVA